MSQKKPWPASVDSFLEAFEGPLIEACPLKIGTKVEVYVDDIVVDEDDSGDGIEVAVCLRLPDGKMLDLHYPGQPFRIEDAGEGLVDDMINRLQTWTGLSRAAVRRRLRRAGFLEPLSAGELEAQ